MTTPTRRAIRTGIAQFFGGPVMDPTTRIYRTTPLAAEGLAGVCATFAKRVGDAAFTQSLLTGRAMGALMVVHLPHLRETRYAWSGATSGVREGDVSVQLHLYHMAQKAHTEDATDDLDDLVEAVIDRIHGDRTLGGACTQAGESSMGIIADVDPPFVKGEVTETYAAIGFEAQIFPNA